MSLLTPLANAFCVYTEERFKGKVHTLERVHRTDFDGLMVNVSFRLPPDLDEIEVFRRINKVLVTVVEGDDGEAAQGR